MSTFLFNEIIFGPINSRRLGISLGVNLLPAEYKVCSFDCLYCECGFNPGKTPEKSTLPSRKKIFEHLESKLKEMGSEDQPPDVITFAGNGEPTLHPLFPEIIDDTIQLRNTYCPDARIAVLSNASRIGSPAVFNALLKIEDNIQKLDSANPKTILLLDRPQGSFDLNRLVENLKSFNGHVTIQTLFVKGTYHGISFDNSSDEEVDAWLKLLRTIAPREVMVYTIARDTPLETMEKIPLKRLKEIAQKVRKYNIPTQVSE